MSDAPKPRTRSAAPKPADGHVSPMFKLLFFSTLGITLLSMVGMVILPFFTSATHDTQAATDTFATVFKMGVGVLFGLVSGKAT
jgi:hypothetical protein